MTTEPMDHDRDSEEAEKLADASELTVIDTRQLFGESREICLEHDGERYRLRITRKGRLILSK